MKYSRILIILFLFILYIQFAFSKSGEGNFNKVETDQKFEILKQNSNEDTVAMFFLLNQNKYLMNLIVNDSISSENLLNLTTLQFKQRYNLPTGSELDTLLRDNGDFILDYWSVDPDSFSCIGCALSNSEKIILLDTMRNYFKYNIGSLDQLFQELRENYLYISNGGGDPDDGPKCPASFYLCCATCAATIGAFPVYIMCCTVCLCGFCKNPPSSCNTIPH